MAEKETKAEDRNEPKDAERTEGLKTRFSKPPANKHKKPTKSVSTPMKH
jgi:hypothetical protein